jgi:hypothetical protein
VDPDPALAAAHGVREFMTHFRWGMEPKVVLEQVTKELEAEFEETKSGDAMKQDEQRRDLDAQLEELEDHHVDFSTSGSERWNATLLKNLFTAEEELFWFGSADLRRYYFFSAGKLWHVGHAYSRRTWPKKTYAQILEEEFKPRFGHAGELKEERDQRSGALLLRWHEWVSSDGDVIRAYDLLDGHGVILVSVVRKEVEDKLGRRLPQNKLDPALAGGEDLDEVLAQEGICYDENGDMIHDPEFCKAQKEGRAPDAKADKKTKKKK